MFHVELLTNFGYLKVKKRAVCCFCGSTVKVESTFVLSVQPSVDSEEKQALFSHRECLKTVLDKSVVDFLHPKI